MRRIKSIQTKIGAALIAIITAILGAFGGYQYLTTQAELTAELQELSTISASRLAEQLTEPLWNYDPMQAEKILRSYMLDRRCYALIIVDPKENIFKGVQRDADWQVSLTREAVTGNFVTASQEIGRDNKQLGRVEVYITPQFMRERLTSELIKIGVTIIILDLALLAGLILVLRRLIIGPLNHLLACTTVIAQGDFRQQIQIQQEDEIGKLAAEFRTMIAYMQAMATAAARIADGDLRQDIAPRSDHDVLGTAFQRMSAYLKQIAVAAENLAQGDLSQDIQLHTNHDLLGKTFRNMNARLNDIVLGVKASATCVTTGSQDLNRTAEQMSQGTSQQAAAAEEVSSSMEEMVANIRQNMENARITEKIALESSADAQKGSVAMSQTIEAMKAIAERISVIQQIANQTNILSLNATIEASKAQDFGKGFAVVASEVRELARHTHEAAKEIDTLVRSCEVITEEAGEILHRLVPNSQRTADLVQEISAASTEQYTGAEQINKAVQQLDTVIQENAATSEEMASAAEELASQAEQLQTAMAFFTVREKSSTPYAQETALSQSLHEFLAVLALDDKQSTQLINTIIALKQDQKAAAPLSQEDANTPSGEEPAPPPKPEERTPLRSLQDEIDADFERF